MAGPQARRHIEAKPNQESAIRAITLTVLLVVSPQLARAATNADAHKQFIKAIDHMMVELGPRSARSSRAINTEYRRHLDLLVLGQYAELEGALGNGGLVPLPADPLRFNVKPRVEGRGPIAEKDLDNQGSYLSARASALGALFEVASRVRSGPVEVTSLVRHSGYQEALRKTNSNARTSVPTHTMGLAFDIALINTPLKTVYEIRNVLQQMQAAGDLLVIGERKQLVFHVVPQPSRLGHFAAVYARTMVEAMPGANVIPSSPTHETLDAHVTPVVSAQIATVRPTEADAKQWWASDGAHSDLVITVSPHSPVAGIRDNTSFLGRVAAGCAALFSGLFAGIRGMMS